jgi:hypothetical protein
MVEAVLQRFETRYGLPRDPARAASRRARIDGALAAMTDEHLEVALARLGLADELVCVRDLTAPIRLKRGETGWQAALAWSEAIAAALEARLRDGPGAGLVRFRRREDAAAALVRAALQDDDRRDWVWRQLGFLPGGAGTPCSAGERVEAAAAAIAAEPARAAVILHRLAGSGWLAALAREVEPWTADHLTAAVAEGAGLVVAADGAERGAIAGPPPMARQAVGRAFVAAIRAAPAEARRAWARLAAMVLEAPRLAAGRAGIEALAARWLHAADQPVVRAADRAQAGEQVGEAAAFHPARSSPPPSSEPPVGAVVNEADRRGVSASSEDAAAPGATEPDAVWTAFGGLLLLLPAVAESGAGEALFDVEEDDPLRGRLHALALELAGAEAGAGDPAVLAFAGLPPTATVPVADEGAEAVARARDMIIDHLRERLPGWAEEDDAALLARIVARPAFIAFEPGWIEVRFDIDAIDLDLRRAGLDLDPDFLPWLGLVLKYRYV